MIISINGLLYDNDGGDWHAVYSPVPEYTFTPSQLDAVRYIVRSAPRDHKIAIIKAVRGLVDMGLREAKTLVELATSFERGC